MNTISIKSTFESDYLQNEDIIKYDIFSESKMSDTYKLIYKCHLGKIDDIESFSNNWAENSKEWLNTINKCPSYTVNVNIKNTNISNKTMTVSLKVEY